MGNSPAYAYRVISEDPQAWLFQARGLKLVADRILPMLRESLARPAISSQEERISYIHSYMFLNGLAFENLIKGILIGRDSTLVANQKVNQILERGGHGIAKATIGIVAVSPGEEDLLQRLEEYLVWAGRYPLPRKFAQYLNSEQQHFRRFITTDPAMVEQIFSRLSELLEGEWHARGNN